jgi:hypothetical protein
LLPFALPILSLSRSLFVSLTSALLNALRASVEIQLDLATHKVVAERISNLIMSDNDAKTTDLPAIAASVTDPPAIAASVTGPPAIAHFAVKAPGFYRKSPETWFRQFES